MFYCIIYRIRCCKCLKTFLLHIVTAVDASSCDTGFLHGVECSGNTALSNSFFLPNFLFKMKSWIIMKAAEMFFLFLCRLRKHSFHALLGFLREQSLYCTEFWTQTLNM